MRLGVVSDVHNNVAGLAYALERLAGCEAVLCLGDLVSDYRVAPEIIRMACDAGLLGIAGNHEKTILLHSGSTLRQRLAAEDLAYLEALPAARELAIDGRVVRVAHGAPWDDPTDYRCEYVFAHNADALARVEGLAADVLLLGHTHMAMTLRRGRTLVLNPGSCGEARDAAGRLSYAELDFGAGVATTYEVRPGEAPAIMARAEL